MPYDLSKPLVIGISSRALFNLEQEIAVNMLELDWFDGIDLTAQQVAAITYMINDEE